MDNENFYDSAAAECLATAYQDAEQKNVKLGYDLFLFALLFLCFAL